VVSTSSRLPWSPLPFPHLNRTRRRLERRQFGRPGRRPPWTRGRGRVGYLANSPLEDPVIRFCFYVFCSFHMITPGSLRSIQADPIYVLL
jgi:hypothetical protein